MKARNDSESEPAVTHTLQAQHQSRMATAAHQSCSAAPHTPNQQPPTFQLPSGPTASYTMQPLPAIARSTAGSAASGINMQYQQLESLWPFNYGVPGLHFPLQLTSVPIHPPAINLNIGNLHQMSDGTVRTSSGSEASSSTGRGMAGNCQVTSGAA